MDKPAILKADSPTVIFENVGDGAMRLRSNSLGDGGDVHVRPGHIIIVETGPSKQVVIRQEKRRAEVSRDDLIVALINADPDDVSSAADTILGLLER